MLTTVYSRLILPLSDRQQFSGLAKNLRHWQRQERLSLQANLQAQAHALEALLIHAHDTCPFYRERMQQAGVKRADLGQSDALAALPVLTRSDLREHANRICSERFSLEQLQSSATGGTTDAPIRLFRDYPGLAVKKSVQQAFWRWAGAEPGRKIFYLWGARTDYVENPGWRWRLYDRRVLRRIWAPVSRLDDAVLEGYRLQINRFRPAVICAYPSALVALADYVRRSGKFIHAPRGLLYTAEAMPAEERPRVSAALGARLFELYASRDVGTIAAECEAHQGMHINPQAALVEYVALGPGEAPYELVITDLLNYGMPLIRYRINDCVAAPPDPDSRCGCGRGWPRLPPLIGRVSDVFRLPDGALVPGVSLHRAATVAPGIAQVQYIQEGVRNFRLRYVPGDRFCADDLAALRRRLQDFLPGDLHWEVERVAAIEREASGKTRFCINRVPVAGNESVHGG